ncbi:MAG: SEL1-like repeat protein [Synergistaceae bacterium]|nr:SEL1-like repeat protein [Synergistaceae bacterium]
MNKKFQKVLACLMCAVAVLGAVSAFAESFNDVLKKAQKGDAEAQYKLGLMYDNGDGVTQDYSEAVKWIRKAAQQELTDAQEFLKKLGETW